MQNTRVLVVDDEPSLRQALLTSLAASGFEVAEAASGEEAIRAVRHGKFDLILLDINMPGMTGIEACRRIRATIARVGIVMITVRDAEDDKIEALEAGADDFVTKPFRFRELLARLRAVLRRIRIDDAPKESVLRAGHIEIDLE